MQCELFHPKNFGGSTEAIDVLVVKDSNHEYQLLICSQCIEALLTDEWVLLLCLNCCSSRWISKELSKRRYDEVIYKLKNCPECTKRIIN